uniref:Ankyrin repeat domain-containing protein n=1 Tax=Eutreptiella gymnastica TaxID=73025 RepID=A0A7S4C764_9EUGL|eukprot:CAMPEP_0174286478 /NCGR_PEP_ID=MMETSP0809-20121228/12038_1 /TAXON_ID=73025 ORGANISM="Eutreptiella gymnastica-like, Strain CCMP1594" /NCGR_SAMPLE_ID=MMETSP0809 /ASSEMBLY_ACC=CAM_ASM_000658 /LENGTH=209 /DNA_ID=CAMNT_0015382569 /DNA_START=70 /DNA_END=699 /DNA_ORIENTATION=+
MGTREYYRQDGVRITHDPYAEGMAEKYGNAGETDAEGFDPYADTVGPGIYGGIVKRDPNTGEVIIGRQYQNHNPTPGPIYTGGGYTAMTKALRRGEEAITALLDKDASLVNEITTGGATPLHMCGMGQDNQRSTAFIISRGGNIEAQDTYGYRPLHRMASNNLAIGAEALLKAGASVNAATKFGETPLSIARGSAARDVIKVLMRYGAK